MDYKTALSQKKLEFFQQIMSETTESITSRSSEEMESQDLITEETGLCNIIGGEIKSGKP